MKHAVITGFADGIGRALALELARGGYTVSGVDRDAGRAAATIAELAAIGAEARLVQADLSRADEVLRAADELAGGPAIDLLAHSAGISAVGRFGELDVAQQQAVIAVNLAAPILLTQALLARQQIARGATIVNIASLSVFTGYPGAAAYAASKDGLAAYGRSLRAALRKQRIGVLTVYPGPTRTAHARRYSPDNRREGRRMDPARLAGLVAEAVRRRRRELVPGFGNRVFAALGRLLPGLTEAALRRAIFERISGG